MVFSSSLFLFIFLPIVLIAYYNPVFKARWFKNAVLLLASLGFYAWGEPIFVLLMMAEIVVAWAIGVALDKSKHRKALLGLGIGIDVAVLFVFKYLTFAAQQIGLLIGETSTIDIALPIGISFFTFQLISYLVDVYRGQTEAQRNIANLALYVAFFPQLIAGPIVRYNQIAAEITSREDNFKNFASGMARFIYGLGKKVLLANYVAQVADNVFDFAEAPSAALAWWGAIAYSLQIYFDFSGYSDMAIGLGRMFGFHFEENFNYPYVARSVSDFWRRWHISLSTWFRDYVYIPLGGNRCSQRRWALNMLAVWGLTGVWHGANWTFIAWGLFYYVLLMAEKTTGFAARLGRFGHVYAMLMVILAWVLFRSADISSAGEYVAAMFGANGLVDNAFWLTLEPTWRVMVVALLGCTPAIANLLKRIIPAKPLDVLEAIWLILVFVVSLLKVIGSSYNPFIYFNF